MTGRATQLDGLRALALLGVAWFHWTPPSWQGGLPWPVGIYYFFALSGYLITGGLLRDRERSESAGGAWRGAALKRFLWRRGLRILAPYYAALLLGCLFRAKDLAAAPLWYLLHLSNWHMALEGWADFTSHFWTLAVQQQFYVVWPFLVWWVPRRWLLPALLVLAAMGPATRALTPWLAQWLVEPGIVTPAQLDFLALGSVLAVAERRGLPLAHRGVRWAGMLGVAGFAACYALRQGGLHGQWGYPLELLSLAVGCCGLIAAAVPGFGGWRGALLNHPVLQSIGKLSYSLYLLHNFAPVMDWVLCYCQLSWTLTGAGLLIRLPVLALFSWGLAWLSWRYIEAPMGRLAAEKR